MSTEQEEQPSAKRARTDKSVDNIANDTPAPVPATEPEDRPLETDWTCVICHEEFPALTNKHTRVRGCKHPLCFKCSTDQDIPSRRKCDLCGIPWETEWVHLDHRGRQTKGEICVPTWNRVIPRVEVPCHFLYASGASATINPPGKLNGEMATTVRATFPHMQTGRSIEKAHDKLTRNNSMSNVQAYPLSTVEAVFLLLSKTRTRELRDNVSDYNAVYFHVDSKKQKVLLGNDLKIHNCRKLTVHGLNRIMGVIESNNIIVKKKVGSDD